MQKFATANAVLPVQTEKTLMGYGKPLESTTPVPTEKPQLKFRQAPTADMVAIHYKFRFVSAVQQENISLTGSCSF